MMGDNQRVRVLSDAVADLTKEVERANGIYAHNADKIVMGPEVAQAIREANYLLHSMNGQLATIAQNLGQLARSPIIGALGGAHNRAENELQSLVTRLDALRSVLHRLNITTQTLSGDSPGATSQNPFA